MKITEQQVNHFFSRMQAFNFGLMQDVRTFIYALRNKDIALDHAIACIEFAQGKTDKAREQDKKDRKVWIKKAKKCPECGQILALAPITDPEGRANVKGYKSMWYCTNGWEHDDPEKWCVYHSFSHLTLNKIFKKMGIKSKAR